MGNRRPRQPKYRHHKPSGQAVVTFGTTDIYLGRYGSAESKDAYDREIADWLNRGRGATSKAGGNDATVNEVLLAYLTHATEYYHGSYELENVKDAIRPVRRLYGSTPAAAFDSLALMAVRRSMVESGLARSTANARVTRIRRCFKWLNAMKLYPADRLLELKSVAGLAIGRTTARETEPVAPVPLDVVEATLPHMPPAVAAMVKIQLLTGCRASDVLRMRGCDIRQGEPNPVYRPSTHKSAWRGHSREIPLGPRAREIVQAHRRPDPAAFLFDPRDAATPGQKGRVKAHYNRRSYRQAVARACDRAFPHPELSKLSRKRLTAEQRAELNAWRRSHRFCPLQLRHSAGTSLRARFGLEPTAAVLGHKKVETSQIYAARDLAKAHEIASEIG